MGLFNRRTTRLADGTSLTKRLPSGGANEIGVAGNSVIGAFDSENRPDKVGVADYITMRQSDGTASALYNILTLPILASARTIEAAEDDTSEEQAEFIRKNLLEPPHKGGMNTPLSLVLADMLRGVVEGFRLFEKVYTVEDGKIVLKKLASRDSLTVTLQRDDDGGYGGAHQQTMFKNRLVDVDIPAWKTFLYTFGKDKNYLYGESAFKAAYYHYTILRKLYYLTNMSVEVAAIPPQILSGDETITTDQKKAALSAFARLGVKTTAWKPANITHETINTSAGRIDPMPIIEHHKVEMARSVLAQSIMLGGTSVSKGGSYALSQDHTDLLTVSVEGIKRSIADHINFYVIAPLIDLNFATPAYPEFHFEDMAADAKDLVLAAFTELVKSGSVSEAVVKGIEDRVAETLDIDTEAIQKQLDKDAAKKAKEDAKNGIDPNAPVVAPVPAPVAPAAPTAAKAAAPRPKGLSDNQWHRPLTPVERKVKFADIQSKLDRFDQEFINQAKPLWNKIKDDAVMRLTKLVEGGDVKALDGFELKFEDEYRKLLVSTMREAYEYAKRGAADELSVAMPGTKGDTTTFIKQQAQAVLDRQFADLTFTIKTEVLKQLRKNTLADHISLGLSEILTAVATAFSLYFDNKIALGGSVAIAQAISRGRDDVFTTQRESIYAYQYSAILDGTTCPICEDLDGSVLDYAEYRSTSWMPPIHMNCRCIYVAILDDEKDPPDLTGLPDDPGGTSAPQL